MYFADDNGIFSFVDDNSVQCFVDDVGQFTFCPQSGATLWVGLSA